LPKTVRKTRSKEKIPTEVRASYACHIQLNLIEELLRDMPALRVSKKMEDSRRSVQKIIQKLNSDIIKDLDGYIKL